MKKELNKKDYNRYMKVIKDNIKETERRLSMVEEMKKVSKLSFEDWVEFQKGKIKISKIL